MTTEYTRNVLKVVVAQICQTIGWHSIQTTPLEFMVDLMQEYIFRVAKLSQEYAQILGRSEVNLDDLGLAFQHMNIDLQELAEYVKNVEPVPCVLSVPKLPVHRESHLNFLKPGSREVITRPVHVHEHLPAMYPDDEEEYSKIEAKDTETTETSEVIQVTNNAEEETNYNNNVVTSNGLSGKDSPVKVSTQPIFKRPGDPVSFDGQATKRLKLNEEGRPLREIHSVIMTTSGYLSTAREGKLPEARTPQQARTESPPPPLPSTFAIVPPPEVKVEKKVKKVSKKMEDGKPENKENKKKKIPKDTLFQPDEIKEVKSKKAGTKDIAKLKAFKGTKAINPNLAGPSNLPVSGKIPGNSLKNAKNNVNKVKIDKSENLSNLDNPMMNDRKDETIDKLPIEPDKQKLNIFKKISSKPKEDKERDSLDTQHKLRDFNLQEDSLNLITDEERHRVDSINKYEDKKSMLPQNSLLNNNISRATEDINVTSLMSPKSDGNFYDTSSFELRTSSTPKTPEFSMPSSVVPFDQQKKKRKDKSGKKKEGKIKNKNITNTKKVQLSNDSMVDMNIPDRPKTPQALEQQQPLIQPSVGTTRNQNLPSMPFPFYPSFPTRPPGPGLIPFPIPMPLPVKGMPVMPAMPGPPAMMQRFFGPKIDGSRPSLVPPSFVNDSHQQQVHQQPLMQPFNAKPLHQPVHQLDKPRTSKSPDKEILKSMIQNLHPPPDLSRPLAGNQLPVTSNVTAGVPAPLVPSVIPPVVPAPLLPPSIPSDIKPPKPEKDKSEKKSKEHKKEKKDKLKKKKEKKEKHKDKGEKTKEKKDKSEKKDKLEKIKEKKEKKEKRKEKVLSKKLAKEEKAIESVPKITLKLGPAGGSPRPPTPDNALMKKITIKPPKKPEDETVKREPTPELARISPLVTRPPKQKSKAKADAVTKKDGTKEDKENGVLALTTKSAVTVDASGRTVWICPACRKQDDGSPMIGCDDCDAWYHWVCVGIQVAPAEDADWYCRLCIMKKEEQYQDKKKKKRKKKMKVSA